jgi:hypothetical protein
MRWRPAPETPSLELSRSLTSRSLIPQSKSKATWPGLLDCLAAGGMAAGEMPMESMCKEAAEEAGVTDCMVKRIRPSGAVCYNGFDQTGWCATSQIRAPPPSTGRSRPLP